MGRSHDKSSEDRAAAGGRKDSVQSLVRALHIVNRIASAEEGLTLTRIAEQVDLAASTVHRLLTTLEQEQYVHFDAEKRRWLIGVQTFMAGNAFLKTRNLVAVARPYMRALMEECRETVKLAVEDNGEAMFLSQSEGPQTTSRQPSARARAPLYCSGAGKALLSGKTRAELARFLRGEGRRRLTVNTIVSGSALHDDIKLARERAYAVDNEELAIGLRCVAAPVFNEFCEPVGAISISGPAGRILAADVSRLGELARRRADQITAKLGGTRPDQFPSRS